MPERLVASGGVNLSVEDLTQLNLELATVAKEGAEKKSAYLYDLCYRTQELLHQIKNNTFNKEVMERPLVENREEKLSYLDTYPEHDLSRINLPYVEGKDKNKFS